MKQNGTGVQLLENRIKNLHFGGPLDSLPLFPGGLRGEQFAGVPPVPGVRAYVSRMEHTMGSWDGLKESIKIDLNTH